MVLEAKLHKKVIVKFFKILRHDATEPTTDDILTIIKTGVDAQNTMERDVGLEVFIQIDRLEKENGLWIGEISRNQKTNFPHEVTNSGPIPLSTLNNLGHGLSFVFDPALSLLVMQFDTRTVSPSRFVSYLKEFGGNSLWHEPIVKKDVINKFRTLPTRKIEIGIASPKNFTGLEGEEFQNSMQNLAEAYGGAKITLTIAAGRGENLPDKAKTFVNKLLENMGSVRKMKITTSQPSNADDHELNLIKDLLSEENELDIDDRDPQKRFNKCSAFVMRCYTHNRAYIESMYKTSKNP